VPTFARRLLLPAAVLAALVLPAPALAACSRTGAAPSSSEAVAATLCLLNAQRAAHGLPALTEVSTLDRAAGAYAGDMVARRFFDHVSPGGGTMMDRIKASGWLSAPGGWSAGENIAWGSGDLGTPARIVDGWMHSAPHRANILNGSFAEIGIGIAAGAPQPGVSGSAGTYVTDFASHGAASAAATSPTSSPKPKRAVARCASTASVRTRKAQRRCAARR
jgi:uncharacterized protein YkwD